MKYILIAAALVFTSSAFAAMLDKEMKTGNGKKVCIYTDGSTKTISEMSFCPLSK